MDDAEGGIALQLRVHDDADGVEVVDLVEALVLLEHLAVDRIDGLHAAFEGEVDVVFLELFRHVGAGVFDEVLVLTVLALDVARDLRVADGIEVGQREVFELLLDALHAETVRERRVDVHGLERRGPPLRLRLHAERAHVVQAVAELDEDHADVLRHGEQHFADVFDVRLFLVLDVDDLHLGQPVHKHGDVVPEAAAQDVDARLVGAVLHRVVQKRRADRIRVESERGDDFRDRDGVGDIGLAAHPVLSLVQGFRVEKGALDFFDVVMLFACRHDREDLLDRLEGKFGGFYVSCVAHDCVS